MSSTAIMPNPDPAVIAHGTCGRCHESARLVGHGAVCGPCTAEMVTEMCPPGYRAEWTGSRFTLTRPRWDPLPWQRERVWCGNYSDVDLLVRDARLLDGGSDGR